ncbi:MAG TPA: RIP metalloprotease RseP [Candidatus Portnoybacteria bacterium]|nr:RIP metalloprotease RseP [Candidatus Portnoybacteria bacterium]
MITFILTFIIGIAILILAHEFGHFIVAKKNGVFVEEFGFGFPPKIFGKKIGETIYSINLIPLGGFVRLYGEDMDQKIDPKLKDRAFSAKKIWQRGLILVAGVLMNLVVGVIFLSVSFFIGMPQPVESLPPKTNADVFITQVMPSSPAQKAGIRVGDKVIGVVGLSGKYSSVNQVNIFQKIIGQNKGKKITLKLLRDGKNIDISIVPRINPPAGEGAMGVALVNTVIQKHSFFESIWLGVKSTFYLFGLIFYSLGVLVAKLFSGQHIGQVVSGPVGIFVLMKQMAGLGFSYLCYFWAILSINLAVINILPFPALDGGRLFFLLIEKIRRKPVAPKIEAAVHQVGFFLLIFLMILVTIKDIQKWW